MKAIDYIAILIRIASIALFLYGLSQLATTLSWIFGGGSYQEMTPQLAVSAIVIVLPLFISVILWFFPFTLAKKLYPMATEREVQPVAPTGILSVLLIAIGLFFLYYAFSDAVYWITYVSILNKANMDIDTSIGFDHKASMIVTGVELAMSLIIIAKAKSLAYWLTSKAR